MPAGEERDEDLADHPLLADDGLGQLALEASGDFRHALERRRLRAAPLGHVPVAIGHRRECTTAGSESCESLRASSRDSPPGDPG